MLQLSLAVTFPLATTAQAAPDDTPSMRFTVVRSSASNCEPACPEWISAEGAIVQATPAALRKLLDTLGGRRLPVIISSRGGNVDAALALGRMIRKNKLDTAVGKTMFDRCKPEDKDCTANEGRGSRYFGFVYGNGAECSSACPLIFAGGVRRVVAEWAFVGVHQVTTTHVKSWITYKTKYKVVNGKKRAVKEIVNRKTVGSYKTYEMEKATETKLAAYLKEMGVDGGMIEVIKRTPATDIRQLSADYMLRWRLTTEKDGVELLIKPDICRTVPAAANCRLFTVAD